MEAGTEFDGLVRRALRLHKQPDRPQGACLSEEDFACFIEGQMTRSEDERWRSHLLSCLKCRSELKEYFAIMRTSWEGEELGVPQKAIEGAKALVSQETGSTIFEIVIAVGRTALELVRTTGEIIASQGGVPVPVLRSRKELRRSEEVRVVKNINNLLADVQIERRKSPRVDVTVRLADVYTKRKVEGIRITLMRGERELESLLTQGGKGTFEELQPGHYQILLSKGDEKIGIVAVTVAEK